MVGDMDLKALERKAWTSYFQDGLWEIIIGTILMVAVLSSTLSAAGVDDESRIAIYVPLMVVLPVATFTLGKRYITVPRLGMVRFGPKRLARGLYLLVGILVTMLLNLAVWAAGALNMADTTPYGAYIIPLDVFAIFCLMAYYFDHKRFYLVAVIMAMAELAVHFLKTYTDITYYGVIAYGIPAAILIGIGLVSLAAFMRRYPIEEETGNAQ